jgi:hypothetical protein
MTGNYWVHQKCTVIYTARTLRSARKLWYVFFTMLVLYSVVEVPVRLCGPENWAVNKADREVKKRLE